jgi:GTP cyclohydrolase I
MPIVGHAFVGVYPGKNVIGLSKFTRIIDHVASRPQIQEEMTQQMADEIEIATQAEGVAIIVKAAHFCMSHRGVKESDSWMTTSVMRGCFLTNDRLKSEFLTLISMK